LFCRVDKQQSDIFNGSDSGQNYKNLLYYKRILRRNPEGSSSFGIIGTSSIILSLFSQLSYVEMQPILLKGSDFSDMLVEKRYPSLAGSPDRDGMWINTNKTQQIHTRNFRELEIVK
jgi:hypothetical protein